MPRITYIETSGKELTYDLPLGATIMEGAVQNGVKGIVAECGGSCMCATCHVYVDEAFLELLPDIEEEEAEMLEGANAPRQANSRLGCQVRISKKLDGLIVRIPETQRQAQQHHSRKKAVYGSIKTDIFYSFCFLKDDRLLYAFKHKIKEDMNAESKKKLEQYKNNELPNTEGVEQSLIREAIRQQDRAKWANMLADEGIQKEEKIIPLVSSVGEKRPALIRRLAPFAVGLAAAIAFLVYIYTPSADSFDDMILKNPKSGVEVRMGNNDEIEAWKKASAAYNNKEYEEAVKNISTIAQPTSEQSFYLALSSMYQKQPDFVRSSAIFKTLVDKNDATYVDEARWYLAYSYYKMGQKQDAQSILKSIVESKGYNHEKAKVILENELK